MKPKSDEGQGSTSVADRAKDAASYVGDKAKDAASYVSDKSKTMASSAMHSAEDAAKYVGDRADDATTSVGGGLKSLGSTLRENSPKSSMMGDASCAVADSLESAGRYLEDEGLAGISEDMTAMIRRNPIPALLIAVGIGFLVARAMTPSRS